MTESKQKTQSLKSQSAWIMSAKIIGFGFSFILPLLVVRLLSKDQVGVYQQSFIVIMNAVSILSLGFAMSSYYYLSRDEKNHPKAIFNILFFHFVMGGLAWLTLFFFPQLLGAIFNSEEMVRLAPLIGVAIWIWIFSMFLETVAIANQESRLATVFIVFAQFTKAVFMILAVVLFTTVEAIIYAAIIQGALQTLILIIYLKSRFPKFWVSFDPSFFREQLVYAIPFGIAGIVWTMQTDIHYYFVGNRFSEADLAIYRYGCFQLPLMLMLAESVISVLIPKMSELQLKNDTQEMIRITVNGMQKLAFFFFPIYIFLMITSKTFIITLFTRSYLPSQPIFIVFLTLVPFHILISDPIVRAYKELGNFLLTIRIITFIVLITALYFGVHNFGLTGIIAIVVVIRISEMIVVEAVTFRKIGVRLKDLDLFKGIGKTAVVSIIAGIVTFAVYYYVKDFTPKVAESLLSLILDLPKQGLIDFISGGFTLGISFTVFAIIYLPGSNYLNLIDEDEKELIKRTFGKLSGFWRKEKIQNPQSQIQN